MELFEVCKMYYERMLDISKIEDLYKGIRSKALPQV